MSESKPKMKVLDLFAGIGGFSLGLERTGGFETVAFCEIGEFPRKILAKHWPGVPIHRDVRSLTGYEFGAEYGDTVDVICGGFPCQDISIAGVKKGMGNGTRSGLWGEFNRLISILQPQYAIIENVSNLLVGPDRTGRWFSRILSDLASIGYDAEWQCIPASAVGAPQIRSRVWVIAYPASKQLDGMVFQKTIFADQEKSRRRELARAIGKGLQFDDYTRIKRNSDVISRGMDRLKALGNAVVPQIPEMIGRAILETEKDTP